MMSDHPTGSGSARYESLDSLHDYASALGTIRAARFIFMLLLILCLLVHLGAYCALRWDLLVDAKAHAVAEHGEAASSPETETQTQPAPAEATPAAAETELSWYFWLELLLPFTRFLAMVSAGLLVFCFALAVNVCLAGRLGGARGSVSAFFWILVVCSLLFPWEHWLTGIPISGVFVTLDELKAAVAKPLSRPVDQVYQYARFIAYPFLALLIALVGNSRFGRAMRDVNKALASRFQPGA